MAAAIFKPADLSDHKHSNQTLYQLRHEPVMKKLAFMLDNIITILQVLCIYY